MRILLSISLILLFSVSVSAQVPRKAMKLQGEWVFKSGNGFDVWSYEDNKLLGSSYRISKLGDTLLTDKTTITMTETGVLVHTVESNRIIQDSIQYSKLHFISNKRKLKFVNLEGNSPYSIEYKFGFLNRKKLKIRIKFGVNSETTELIMIRAKD